MAIRLDTSFESYSLICFYGDGVGRGCLFVGVCWWCSNPWSHNPHRPNKSAKHFAVRMIVHVIFIYELQLHANTEHSENVAYYCRDAVCVLVRRMGMRSMGDFQTTNLSHPTIPAMRTSQRLTARLLSRRTTSPGFLSVTNPCRQDNNSCIWDARRRITGRFCRCVL